jgi:hypothetical protein
MLSAEPMDLSSKSRAATVMAVVMDGDIAAVVAIITAGAVATTMAGGIIAIGGDSIVSGHFAQAASVGGLLILRVAEKRPQGLGADLGPPIPTAGNAETSRQRSAKLLQLG